MTQRFKEFISFFIITIILVFFIVRRAFVAFKNFNMDIDQVNFESLNINPYIFLIFCIVSILKLNFQIYNLLFHKNSEGFFIKILFFSKKIK